jgi:hypothetical protein
VNFDCSPLLPCLGLGQAEVTRETEPIPETFAVCESDTGERFELKIRESVRPAPPPTPGSGGSPSRR